MEALESYACDCGIGVIIILNAIVLIIETDSRASGRRSPSWIYMTEWCFCIFFTVELVVRMIIYRFSFFDEHDRKHNILDLVVVSSDLVVKTTGTEFPIMILRVLRLGRVVRLFRMFTMFDELMLMMQSFLATMRSIFWACILLFCLLSLWSVVAVELIHPVNLKVADSGKYGDCERCSRAFESVMQANLTFMQTIIAGDSWGLVGVPVIEESPGLALIFLGALVTINFGVLNLILTVIVKVANDSAEHDVDKKMCERDRELKRVQQVVNEVCEVLDADKSGCLDLEEISKGFNECKAFAETMKDADWDQEDMEILFNLLDEDRSGSVTYKEFIEQFFKMKTHDEKKMLMILKGQMASLEARQLEQLDLLRSVLEVRSPVSPKFPVCDAGIARAPPWLDQAGVATPDAMSPILKDFQVHTAHRIPRLAKVDAQALTDVQSCES